MFLVTLLTTIISEFQFLSILMLVDFSLRYIHPKFSPVAKIGVYISQNLLQKQPMLRLSSPKRFSVLIGVIFSFFMASFYILSLLDQSFTIYYLLFAIFLIIASGLLAFFDVCLGCIAYDYLLKMGLFKSHSIDEFLIDN